jgi:hypothetical protein
MFSFLTPISWIYSTFVICSTKKNVIYKSINDSVNLFLFQHFYLLFILINQNWFNLHIHQIYLSHLNPCLKLFIFNKNIIGSILVAKSKALNLQAKSSGIPVFIHAWWSQWINLIQLSQCPVIPRYN